jgi:polyhydroxybutyrate depolymerase
MQHQTHALRFGPQRWFGAVLVSAAALCSAACWEEPFAPDGGVLTDAGAGVCGSRPARAGEQRRQIVSGGVTRTFITYAPASLDPHQPAPLVLIFHGALMTAESMRDVTGFEELAEAKGFLAVFPNGDPTLTWNIRPKDAQVCGIGELVTNPDADDLGFVDAIIADVQQTQCVDRSHIFATGFSMGGYFSNHLACQRPELLRAAAPHGSGTYKGTCKGRVPMLILHGSGDLGVDFECGVESRELWVTRNSCSAQVEREPIEGGHCERHVGCPKDGDVTFCQFDDMCHGWAGHGTGSLFCTWDFGSGPGYEDATALIWRFFEAHW